MNLQRKKLLECEKVKSFLSKKGFLKYQTRHSESQQKVTEALETDNFSLQGCKKQKISEILIKTTPNYTILRRLNGRPSGRSCEDN